MLQYSANQLTTDSFNANSFDPNSSNHLPIAIPQASAGMPFARCYSEQLLEHSISVCKKLSLVPLPSLIPPIANQALPDARILRLPR